MTQGDAARPEPVRITFGDVTLDIAALTVHRAGHLVTVEPQVFDVLRYLVEHRERVVPKQEMLEQVWGDTFVSESSLTSRIRSARVAVGDDGRSQRVIRTVHGRGYQFVAPVESDIRPPSPLPPVPDAPDVTTGRLRRPAKELIDRYDITAQVCAAIGPGRLVTLVGPAGVGKTLLAQHVGASIAGQFPGGSWVVSLADVRHTGGVAQSVLDALNAARFPSGSSEDTVVSLLSGVEGLLLLDNCEHVLEEASALLTRLRAQDDRLAVLATSRQRLGVAGEIVVDVPVLTAEHGVELFVRRAAEQGVSLPSSSTMVAEVCEALDQLPLALELACAQTRVLGVEHLAGLLDQRFELLRVEAGGRAALTLEGAIAASYVPLDAEQQETLGRFAQFGGFFDLDAAQSVATHRRDLTALEAVRHVMALAERSLIEVDNELASPRYRLLESIRLYADEHMRDQEAARRAHVACFHDRAADQSRRLVSGDVESAWREMRADWPNHRLALLYAIDLALVADALELLNTTIDCAEISLALEHATWSEDALALADANGHVGADLDEARAGHARMVAYEHRIDELLALLSQVGDRTDSYSVTLSRFWAAGSHGDLPELARSFALLERQVRGTGGIRELTVGAISPMAAHNPDIDPMPAQDRALRVGCSTGAVGHAFRQVILANRALGTGDVEGALAACDEAIDLAEAESLTVLCSQAHALRVRAVADDPDHTNVAGRTLDAMLFYRAHGHWASARNDAAVAARALADAGLHEAAADVLDGYRPVRYRSVDPEYVAEVRKTIADTLGAGLDALVRDGVDGDSHAFCDFVIGQLRQVVPNEDGTEA